MILQRMYINRRRISRQIDWCAMYIRLITSF